MFCSNCGAQIPEGSIYCSNCGHKISQKPAENNLKRWLLVLLTIIAVVAFCVLLVFLIKMVSKNKVRKYCMTKETRYDSSGYLEEYMYEYDDKGNLIKTIYLNIDGDVEWYSEYENDANGQKIKETYYTADRNIDAWIEYENDEKGLCKKRTDYLSDRRKAGWRDYDYDNNGNLITETVYDSDGDINEWIEYEYDASGNLSKRTNVLSNGVINEWTEYEYDTNGYQTKETIYGSDGNISEWIEHSYDPDGNLKLSLYRDDDGSSPYLRCSYEWEIIEYTSESNDSPEANSIRTGPAETAETAATVPESLLQVKIDECLNEWNMYDCDSSDYEIFHEPDEASHMDSVTIVFKFRYPYGYIQTDYKISYQYDQSSDLWTPVSDGQSSNSIVWDNIDRFVQSYDGTVIYPALYGIDCDTYYSINITEINTENKTAQISADVSYVHFSSDHYRDEDYFDGSINIDELAYFTDARDNPNHYVIEQLRETDDDRALLKLTLDAGHHMTCWISLKRGLAIYDSDWWDPEKLDFSY